MSKVIVQWSSFVGDLAYASTMSNKISLENCRRKSVTVLNSMCSCLIPLVFQVALGSFDVRFIQRETLLRFFYVKSTKTI